MLRSVKQRDAWAAALMAIAAVALSPGAAMGLQPLPRHAQLRAPVTTGVAGPDSASSFSATLPNGRRVTPVGDNIIVGTTPLSALLTPDGRYLVTSNDNERAVSCASTPCNKFSQTTQNGAGQMPAGYTLTVLRVDKGAGAPAVAKVAFTGGAAIWTRIGPGPVGHRQIAMPGFNVVTPAGSPARSPDLNLRTLWLGLAMKPLTATSAELYAAGGPNNAVGAYTLDWSNPSSVTFRLDATVGIPNAAIPSSNDDANKGEAAPGGLVLDGNTLWVLNNNANNVQRFDVSVAQAPAASGDAVPVGFFPFGAALADGKLFVTNWGVSDRETNATWRATVNASGIGNGTLGIGGGATPAESLFADPATDPARSSSVSVLDAVTGASIGSIGLGRSIDGLDVTGGTHPSAIVSGDDGVLYVTDTNEDTLAVVDGHTNELVRKIALPSPAPPGLLGDQVVGLQPDALAYDSAGHRLYVAEAGLNSVAVMDTTNPREPQLVGRIPTGWYPTALQLSADGQTLFVANAKGAGSFLGFPGENDFDGAVPFDGQPTSSEDVNFQFGTVQRIDLAGLDLAASSAQVESNTVAWGDPRREKVLREVGPKIRHVFYILKENKTYDSYFGADSILNARGADGYPGYAQWDANVPNMKRLAEQFAIGDNIYADAEESDAGHAFVLTGQSTDYQQKTLGSRAARTVINVKNQDPEDYPLTGYLFNDLARNGASFRDYGDTVRISGYDEGRNPDPCQDDPGQSAAGQPCSAATYDPSDTTSATIGFGGRYATTLPALSVLAGKVDVNYPGWNVRITDQRRAREFVKDMGRRIADGTVPEFTFIWLPQDHTGGLGLSPCGTGCTNVTAAFQVRDGDAATGQVVDFLSHSTVWHSSAIFIAADDAQSTADHVYAHRTYAAVVSPWAKRNAVVHTLGSTVSVTKTVEELLGIPPMSYGDAMATDLADFFTTTPDDTPYDVVGAPALRYAGAGEARMARGLRPTPGRVRASGTRMKVPGAPRIARRIARLLDRLDGGLDQDTARIGAISGLWMQSVRLARSHHAHGRAYHRAQDRLYARAKAVVGAD